MNYAGSMTTFQSGWRFLPFIYFVGHKRVLNIIVIVIMQYLTQLSRHYMKIYIWPIKSTQVIITILSQCHVSYYVSYHVITVLCINISTMSTDWSCEQKYNNFIDQSVARNFCWGFFWKKCGPHAKSRAAKEHTAYMVCA